MWNSAGQPVLYSINDVMMAKEEVTPALGSLYSFTFLFPPPSFIIHIYLLCMAHGADSEYFRGPWHDIAGLVGTWTAYTHTYLLMLLSRNKIFLAVNIM